VSRQVTRLGALAASLMALAAAVPWFASCAGSEAEEAPPEEGTALPGERDGSVLPEAAADAGTIVVDAGTCDAADPTCSAGVLTCDQADFCSVTTPVSTLYALTSVWGSSKNDVWAVGSGGTIIHYDGGAWKETPTPVKNTFHAVWGTGPTDVWAASMTNALFHSTGFASGTATWTAALPAQAEPDDAFPRAVLAVWGSPGAPLRIGARDRTVYDPMTGSLSTVNQYTLRLAAGDAGAAWERVEGIGAVHSFWGSSPTDLWYVADNSDKNGWQKGVTMHGTAKVAGGAMQWQSVDSQSSVVLEGIWGSGPGDVWAVGDMGVLRHMTPAAPRWAIVPSPTDQALHAIWGSAANDIWAVGDHGTILHFDGVAWKLATAALPLGKKRHLHGVWGSSANDVWIVGDGVTLHYTGPKAGGGS